MFSDYPFGIVKLFLLQYINLFPNKYLFLYTYISCQIILIICGNFKSFCNLNSYLLIFEYISSNLQTWYGCLDIHFISLKIYAGNHTNKNTEFWIWKWDLKMTHMEQELPTLPEHLSSPLFSCSVMVYNFKFLKTL